MHTDNPHRNNNREFKQRRQQPQGQGRLKSDFIFNLRILQEFIFIEFVYHCQLSQADCVRQRQSSNKIKQNLTLVVQVLFITQNVVTSRSCFVENIKEINE